MSSFNNRYNTLLESLKYLNEEKVRLDRKCWKGKKIGNPKTKMKGGVRVNNCVPKESKKKLTENTVNLPVISPFGFFILRTEEVVPIPTIKDSDRVLLSIWPEARSADVYRSAGAIKMINEEDRFLLLYSPRTTSPQTLNLAYKVASHYNLPTADHTTLNESRYQVSGQIIFKDPFGTGRKYHPVDEIVDAASEGQAALKAAKRIAKQKGFRNSYYEVGRGYRVTALPDVQPPKPRLPYKDDDDQMDLFSEYFFRTAAGDQRVTDTSATAEAIYADGQDSTVPAVQTLTDQTGKESVIQDVIRDLEDLKVNHNWNTKLDDDLIRAMADTLEGIGVEPTDMYAAIGADARRQKQYLITGPSSWKGGNGALNDLKAILAGNEPQEIEEDESVPSSDLPYGSADSNPGMADLSEMKCWKGYARVKGKRPGSPGSCRKVKENFMDKKGPGRPGDSKRHGIKKKASLASLDKIVKSKTASPRKKQLAHWQANMRRGKAKKKR